MWEKAYNKSKTSILIHVITQESVKTVRLFAYLFPDYCVYVMLKCMFLSICYKLNLCCDNCKYQNEVRFLLQVPLPGFRWARSINHCCILFRPQIQMVICVYYSSVMIKWYNSVHFKHRALYQIMRNYILSLFFIYMKLV